MYYYIMYVHVHVYTYMYMCNVCVCVCVCVCGSGIVYTCTFYVILLCIAYMLPTVYTCIYMYIHVYILKQEISGQFSILM